MFGKRILAKALAGESGRRVSDIRRYGQYDRLGNVEQIVYCGLKIVASPVKVEFIKPVFGDFDDDYIGVERELVDMSKYA